MSYQNSDVLVTLHFTAANAVYRASSIFARWRHQSLMYAGCISALLLSNSVGDDVGLGIQGESPWWRVRGRREGEAQQFCTFDSKFRLRRCKSQSLTDKSATFTHAGEDVFPHLSPCVITTNHSSYYWPTTTTTTTTTITTTTTTRPTTTTTTVLLLDDVLIRPCERTARALSVQWSCTWLWPALDVT